jgi:Glycosyl hydrolases family 18
MTRSRIGAILTTAVILAGGAIGITAAPAQAASGLPVAPYVDMGAWPTPSLSTMSKASGVKGYTLGFVTGAGCKASWFNAYDPRAKWQLAEINKIRSAGGNVVVSFGGASGIELAQACSSVSSLAAEYQAVVKAYSLKYIDLDIEGAAVADPASIKRRSQALAQVQKATGVRVSLTLPVLPSGLTADGLNVVKAAKSAGVKVDVVNVMAMDYYSGGGDYGTFAVDAANHTYNQVKSIYSGWASIAVTPMIGKNDDGGTFNQGDATQLVNFAKGKHLGRLAFWETTRDRNACNGALYMCTNIKQKPYDFSKIFAGYKG